MMVLSEDEFWNRLQRLNAFKADNPESGSLTKDSLNKDYICGCGENHKFTHSDTVIVWRQKLSGAFVLKDIHCDYSNFVRKKGLFSISLETEFTYKDTG
ncbi:hypothetical protein N9D21_00335 [Candidatus Pelagibacter sp.]|jgi:hypothetical protein|nr:hypothetical protein [Candidatus Pelagibacter sp.]MDA9966453.1 hypothetical protein [Candidatus Pelagibacter sp.]MDC1330567.1 hypothetical protein [Pelagibacteraceae bacterium]